MANTYKNGETPVFKDMNDKALQQAIKDIQSLAYNASEVKSLGLGRLLRDLDIAVAVKRQRIRAGTWTLPA